MGPFKVGDVVSADYNDFHHLGVIRSGPHPNLEANKDGSIICYCVEFPTLPRGDIVRRQKEEELTKPSAFCRKFVKSRKNQVFFYDAYLSPAEPDFELTCVLALEAELDKKL